MDNVVVLYYDGCIKKDNLYKLVQQIRQVTQSTVIVLPKNYDILLDASIDQLCEIRNSIDKVIATKTYQKLPKNNLIQ